MPGQLLYVPAGSPHQALHRHLLKRIFLIIPAPGGERAGERGGVRQLREQHQHPGVGAPLQDQRAEGPQDSGPAAPAGTD